MGPFRTRNAHRHRTPLVRLIALAAFSAVMITMTVASGPAATAQDPGADEAAGATITRSVEVPVIADIGVISHSLALANGGADGLALFDRGFERFDHNFLRFDLDVLPDGATIVEANLVVYLRDVTDPLDVELGLALDEWSEHDVVVNGSTVLPALDVGAEPDVDWLGVVRTATTDGELGFGLDGVVEDWRHGLVLRGQTASATDTTFDSRESDFPARLEVTYSVYEPLERPDLGDAPDSTNNRGVSNTAYADMGWIGSFPTVFDDTNGGEPGPHHGNEKIEGFLGDYMSAEQEADGGPDDDPANNILVTESGIVADVFDQDHGDDGWRNRNIEFGHCERETLEVRVSAGPDPTLEVMYLNVWFDGNRDGDWDEITSCPTGATAEEWIVQDFEIDMDGIEADGFQDLNVLTLPVPNGHPFSSHEVRFTLSDTPVKPLLSQSGAAEPVGSGWGPAAGWEFGETEDYLYQPSPALVTQPLLYSTSFDSAVSETVVAGHQTFDFEFVFINQGWEPIDLSMHTDIDQRLRLLHSIHLDPPFDGSQPGQVQHADGSYASTWTTTLDWPPAEYNAWVGFDGTVDPGEEIHLWWTGTVTDAFQPLGCDNVFDTTTIESVLNLVVNDVAEVASTDVEASCLAGQNGQVNPYDISYTVGDSDTQMGAHESFDFELVFTNNSAEDIDLTIDTEVDQRLHLLFTPPMSPNPADDQGSDDAAPGKPGDGSDSPFDLPQDGKPGGDSVAAVLPPFDGDQAGSVQHLDGSYYSNWDVIDAPPATYEAWWAFDGIVPAGEELRLWWTGTVSDAFVPGLGCDGLFNETVSIPSVLNMTVDGAAIAAVSAAADASCLIAGTEDVTPEEEVPDPSQEIPFDPFPWTLTYEYYALPVTGGLFFPFDTIVISEVVFQNTSLSEIDFRVSQNPDPCLGRDSPPLIGPPVAELAEAEEHPDGSLFYPDGVGAPHIRFFSGVAPGEVVHLWWYGYPQWSLADCTMQRFVQFTIDNEIHQRVEVIEVR